MGSSENHGNWLDGIIGWEPGGNKIETVNPSDPAVDEELSDIDKFLEDNFNPEHLVYKSGKKPVRVVISLPDSTQWASIQHHLRDMAIQDDGHGGFEVISKKLFEMCVRFPDAGEKLKPEYRQGLYRLPEQVMTGILRQFPSWVQVVGGWLVRKYALTEEEKKVSSQTSTEKTS